MDSSCLEETLDPNEIPSNSPQNIIEHDDTSTLKDENIDYCLKPTFKNSLQAKKRLQAFAQQKQILISPKAKTKSAGFNEKLLNDQFESQENLNTGIKSKKETTIDKAKATVEEIELLKKSDFAYTNQKNDVVKVTRRSRSKSSEHNFIFRKRERKVRNYRKSDSTRRSPSPTITTARDKYSRRSPSPTITTARDKYSEKPKAKYPRNWDEFNRDQWTFEKLMCKDSHLKGQSSNTPNDIFRQLLFDSPSESIKPYHFKNERGEEVTIPYKFLRFTLTRPRVSYNENLTKVKESYLNRKQVLSRTHKDHKEFLEKFYTRNPKKIKPSEPMGQRNWYLKNWKDSDSKVLETSIGLSFLLNYSDDEEEDDQVYQNEYIEKSAEEKKDRYETNLKIEETSKTADESTKDETEHISIKEVDRHKDKKTYSPSRRKYRTKSESTNEGSKIEEVMSWTPERKTSLSEDTWKESPKIKREKEIEDENKLNNKKQDGIVKSIPSDDEWAETPERKNNTDKDKKKNKKKSKHEYKSDSSSSSLDEKKSKKKKKKLARKKKQKEKEKKARKKEKLKAEKLKQKKKQKKKEILKKLKKEFKNSFEKKQNDFEKPIKVKIEKKDEYEDVIQPAEDSRKCLGQKEFEEVVSSEKKEIDLKVKKEKKLEETVKVSEKIEEEENTQVKDSMRNIEVKTDLFEKLSPELCMKQPDKEKPGKKVQVEEHVAEPTPDTEEYQSNWESDDGVSVVKPGSKRTNRGWESDEEVFERAFSKKKPSDNPFGASPVLEMPLDIKFPRRSYNKQEKKRSRTRSPEYLDMKKEIKLLEAERINLNKQRMQLEMEKIRIHELERKKSIEEMEYRDRRESSPVWRENRDRWHTREDDIHTTSRENRLIEEHHSRNDDKADEIATSSINISKSSSQKVEVIHSSPEITSTKSPTHTVLESAYQEFMRAVSGGNKTGDILISSSESEVPCQKNKSSRTKSMISKSQRDRNRERNDEVEEHKIQSITDPKILQEIILPGEIPMPELPTVPAPVPSPKLDLHPISMSVDMKTTAQIALVQAPSIKIMDIPQPVENRQASPNISSPKKPFTFSTIKISTKRPLLLERSNWKLDNDSDEEMPPKNNTVQNNKLEESIPEKGAIDPLPLNKEVIEMEQSEITEGKMTGREVIDKEKDTEDRREFESSHKRKHSRSPLNTSRDKRRREDDVRKRDDEKRRDFSSRRIEEYRKKEELKRSSRSKKYLSPSRHRGPSPRRRRYSSPIHKRSPPKHRSPSRRTERRPERSERRSPPISGKRRRSYSPARNSPMSRRRSPPSPRESSQYSRMSKSPRLSPMEGLKRSVADSTISDDLLPQHYAVDSSSSPLCSSTPAPLSRRQRLALSPKRPSLDERINQVLGIENEPQHQPVQKPTESLDPRQNSLYSNYHLQHSTSNDLGNFSSAPPRTSSKNLQVGNIIQVVPSEDFGQPPPQPVAPPSQKILQVGNMLQIVPSEMEPVAPPQFLPEPPRGSPLLEKSIAVVNVPKERRSAENVLDERMADRLKKRQEKEERKKEKERKRKEKVKKKKMRLKVSTEEMIKRALELDGYIGLENEDLNAMIPEVISSTPGLDPSRSILSSSTSRFLDSSLKTEKERKSVQFADGIRPGEGTSPSGGEELSSPPPQSDALLKPKKHKKTVKKKKKRKVKVKKRRTQPSSPTESEEEYENLPPPSPPPGSPPPHVFPPRAKVHTINNIPQHYLPSYGITTAPQTPPVVHSQSRMNPAFQNPPTAIYRTPPPHVNVIGQHFPRMNHAPPMGMNVPPPSPAIHRDQQTYGPY